jgi:hypothetical protein
MLQEDTMTKMAVLGKGSMRNKQHVKNISKRCVFIMVDPATLASQSKASYFGVFLNRARG